MNYKADFDLDGMGCFFNPKSIAIVGASTDMLKLNSKPLAALLKKKYSGKLYPINPRYDEIEGVKCYSSILEVSEDIDMVVVGLPHNMILDVINQCVYKNVKSVIIFSGGFAETGEEGRILQDQITKIADENNIKVLGPNCFGFMSMRNSIMATFVNPIEDELSLKPFGFITQSGLMGILAYVIGSQQGIGLNCFASVGNELNTDFSDFASYLIHDKEIKVVGGYLEEIKNVKKFRAMAKTALEHKKPLLLIKAGSSKDGKRAAYYHTASKTGDDKVYEGLFKQLGVIRMDNINDFWPLIKIHAAGRVPKGRNVAIITGSGGTGILLADLCEKLGLNIPEIEGETLQQLSKVMPFFASGRNPVDMTTAPVNDVNMMPNCLRTVVNSENIDIVLVCTFGNIESEAYMRKAFGDLIDIYKSTEKTIVLCMDPKYLHPEVMKMLEDAGVPVVSDEYQVVRAIAKLAWYWEKQLLISEQDDFCRSIKFVGKRKDFDEIKKRIFSCQSEKLLSDLDIDNSLGEEPITEIDSKIKIINNPAFGYILNFSLGGIIAESLGLESNRILPINHADSKEIINEVMGYRALKREYCINEIAEVIYKVSKIFEENSDEIDELNISMSINRNSVKINKVDMVNIKQEDRNHGHA